MNTSYTLHLLKSAGQQRVGAYINEHGDVALFNAPDIAQAFVPGGRLFPPGLARFTTEGDRALQLIAEIEQITGKPADQLRITACAFTQDRAGLVRHDDVQSWKLDKGELIAETLSAASIPMAVYDMQDALLLNVATKDTPMSYSFERKHFGDGWYFTGVVANQKFDGTLFMGPDLAYAIKTREELLLLSSPDRWFEIGDDAILQLGPLTLMPSIKVAHEMQAAAREMLDEVETLLLRNAPARITSQAMPEIMALLMTAKEDESAREQARQTGAAGGESAGAPEGCTDWRSVIDDAQRIETFVGWAMPALTAIGVPGLSGVPIIARGLMHLGQAVRSLRQSKPVEAEPVERAPVRERA